MYHLSSTPTPAQKLLASIDVLEEILFLACLNSDALGPPAAIYPLSLTCKHFASVFSTSRNPTLFERLFISSFGISPQRFVTRDGEVIVFIRSIWTVLKKFRALSQERHQLPITIGTDDWTLISRFISLVALEDQQAFRQLILYAHVDDTSRNLLLDALYRTSGRSNPTTWRALGIWWATHLHSIHFT
jgi:hypothetical protein